VWEGHPSFLLILGRILGFVTWTLVLAGLGYAFLTYGLPLAAQVHAPLRPTLVTHETRILNSVIAVLGTVLLLKLAGLLLAAARVKATHYRLTSQRLLIESGLLSKSVEEIDLRYVDDLQFRQTFLDRLLGIGNVDVVSSDKLAPKIVIRGIADPRGVRETIRAHAYQASQRQFFTRST
jgi:uncharacterized membrane protein YdbT with pleckstrin-like domain